MICAGVQERYSTCQESLAGVGYRMCATLRAFESGGFSGKQGACAGGKYTATRSVYPILTILILMG